MSHSLRYIAGALVLSGSAALIIPVRAHDGHAKSALPVSDPNAPKQVSAATARAIDLQTGEVDFGRVESIVRLTGVVQAKPDAEFVVASPLPGIVQSVRVVPGERVHKGDVLVVVESAELARLAFEQAAAAGDFERLQSERDQAALQLEAGATQLGSLESRAALVRAEVDRLTAAEGTITGNLLSQRQADALRQEAEVETFKASQVRGAAMLASLDRQLRSARDRIDALASVVGEGATTGASRYSTPGRLVLTAVADGVVVSRSATVGSGVSPGQTLLEISNFDNVQIEGELPDALVNQLQGGSGFNVRVYRLSARKEPPIATGTVRVINPVIDPHKRTAHVLIDVPNHDLRLLKGQFVDLAVVVSAIDDAVVVPASAIVKDGPLQWVYVQEGTDAERVFVKRDIATGTRSDLTVEVLEGLVPGDIVVTRSAFSLSLLRGVGDAVDQPDSDLDRTHDHSGHSH